MIKVKQKRENQGRNYKNIKDKKEYRKSKFVSKTTKKEFNDKYEVDFNGELFQGKLLANARGFGFVQLDNPEIEDVFIAPTKLNGAFNNDIVKVVIYKSVDEKNTSREGEIKEIVSRGTNQVVGNFQAFKNSGFVIPDNKKFYKDIFVSSKNTMKAKDGDKVVVKITDYGSEIKGPSGEIIEVIGDMSKKGDDIIAIIRNYELYQEFPSEVKESVKNVPLSVSAKDIEGRKDFRNILTCTIDGEDSRDFDDAISLEINDKGNLVLGVHIADVGHYVKMNSIIDKEAFNRGTSVYFPDMVLPMLPIELSNGICSLNPKVDRLTLSCMMELDDDANVISYDICESVINSNERMTYNNVYGILQGDKKLRERYSAWVDRFENMLKISNKLIEKRSSKGALDFDLPEAYIKVDDTGKTIDIVKRERNDAHKLIESFMILANEVVAEHFNSLGVPFVYRVHAKPTEEKTNDFLTFASGLGIKFSCNSQTVDAKDLQKIIKLANEKEIGKIISEVLLRSMQKAMYETNCRGHFGLASRYYCHFTSPIRRYPDLTIHRIIKMYLNNKVNPTIEMELKDFAVDSATRSSEREKLAEKAEREVDAYKKAEFMQQFVGNQYKASITGVTSNGIFVGLENTVEGFVSIDSLPDDHYVYNEKSFSLMGKNDRFIIGQDVFVQLMSVNLKDRRIEFAHINKLGDKPKNQVENVEEGKEY